MDSARADQQERVLQAISAKRWTQVDEIWLEVNDGELPPVEFHQPIIDKLLRKQQPQHFISMYDTTLEAYLAAGRNEEALEIIEYILSHGEDLEFLRPHLLKAARANYENSLEGQFDVFLEKSGLENEGKKLKDAFGAFTGLLGAIKGQVYRHAR